MDSPGKAPSRAIKSNIRSQIVIMLVTATATLFLFTQPTPKGLEGSIHSKFLFPGDEQLNPPPPTLNPSVLTDLVGRDGRVIEVVDLRTSGRSKRRRRRRGRHHHPAEGEEAEGAPEEGGVMDAGPPLTQREKREVQGLLNARFLDIVERIPGYPSEELETLRRRSVDEDWEAEDEDEDQEINATVLRKVHRRRRKVVNGTDGNSTLGNITLDFLDDEEFDSDSDLEESSDQEDNTSDSDSDKGGSFLSGFVRSHPWLHFWDMEGEGGSREKMHLHRAGLLLVLLLLFGRLACVCAGGGGRGAAVSEAQVGKDKDGAEYSKVMKSRRGGVWATVTRVLGAGCICCLMISLAGIALVVYLLLTEPDTEMVVSDLLQQDEFALDAEFKQYTQCAARKGPKPTLEGISLFRNTTNLTSKAIEDANSVFVHMGNYDRLLNGHLMLRSPRNKVQLMLPLDEASIQRSYQFRSCAVIGNSGMLRWSSYGRTIDAHDLVLRLNQAPTNRQYRRHVGSKSSFRMINRQSTAHYGSGRYIEKGLPLEAGVTLVVSRTDGHQFEKLHRRMKLDRPDVSILYLSSRMVGKARAALVKYRIRLCQAGYGPYSGGIVPSSGIVGIFMLMQMCQNVTVYGFGNTYKNLQFPYHYYKGVGSRKFGDPVHSFSSEEAFVVQLAQENHINLCQLRMVNTTCRENKQTCMHELREVEKYNRVCGFNPYLLQSSAYFEAIKSP